MKRFTILLTIATFCAIITTSCNNNSSTDVKATSEISSCKDQANDSKNCEEKTADSKDKECCKEEEVKTTSTDKKYGRGVITPSTEKKKEENKK